jgi:hypothetical protein
LNIKKSDKHRKNTNVDINNLLEDGDLVMENIYERIDIEQYISYPNP